MKKQGKFMRKHFMAFKFIFGGLIGCLVSIGFWICGCSDISMTNDVSCNTAGTKSKYQRVMRFPDGQTEDILYFVDSELNRDPEWWWPNPRLDESAVAARGEVVVDADKKYGLILRAKEHGDPLSVLDKLDPNDLHTLIIDAQEKSGIGQIHIDSNIESCVRMKYLKCLILNHATISHRALEKLTEMKSLEKLCIITDALEDAGVEQIAKMNGLKGLRLYGEISNKSVEYISKMDNIEELFVGGRYLFDGSLFYISNMMKLKTLALPKNNCTEEGLKYLAAMDGLEKLDLLGFDLSPAGAGYVANIKNLKSLTLNRAISDRGIERLKSLKSLKELTLQVRFQQFNQDLTDAGLKDIAEIKSMESLSIYSGNFTSNGLKQLSELTNLTCLIMPNTTITKPDYDYLISRLPHLKECSFRNFRRLGDKTKFEIDNQLSTPRPSSP